MSDHTINERDVGLLSADTPERSGSPGHDSVSKAHTLILYVISISVSEMWGTACQCYNTYYFTFITIFSIVQHNEDGFAYPIKKINMYGMLSVGVT